MIVDISDNLKELLDSIPDDVLEREWKKIKEMEMEGPTADEYFKFLEENQKLTEIEERSKLNKY